MNRFFASIFLIISLLLNSHLALSHDGSMTEHKIAIIDFGDVVEESMAWKDAMKQIEVKTEGYRKDSMSKDAEFKKRYEGLEKQKNALSQEAFDKKQSELNEESMKFRSELGQKLEEIKSAAMDTRKRISEKLENIVAQIAKSKNYDIVLPKSYVVYHSNGMDVTKEVAKMLDKQLPSLKVKI